MSDYFHASDLQAALAALTSIQEYFHEMCRIFTDSITEQRRIFLVFAARIREGRFYACAQTWRCCVIVYHSTAWHAYPIEFHTLLRHRMHADFPRKRLSERGIKSKDATPLLRFLFRPSSCRRSPRVTFIKST